MEEALYSNYNKFQQSSGNILTRLRIVGYPAYNIPDDITISSFEEFREVVLQIEKLTKQHLEIKIKKCFKNYLKKSDILHILKLGNDKFTENQISEAYSIMPVDEDGGILVDHLLNFLY